MCTIAVLRGVSPLAPLIVAGNRDEFYARESRPAAPMPGTDLIAGVDGERGGTWMGATRRGFVAALTNQRQGGFADKSRLSRGEVVARCLRAGEVGAATDILAPLAGRTNPFNMLYGTSDDLRCVYVRDEGVTFIDIPSGISILPNDVLDSADFPKAARAKSRLAVAGSEMTTWPDTVALLTAVLGDHRQAPISQLPEPPPGSLLSADLVAKLDALCVHTPHYGTRSYSIIGARNDALERYYYGDGSPCQTPATLVASSRAPA